MSIHYERRTLEVVSEAADFLDHYHQATGDIVTIIHGGDTDIYLVSDPEWRRKFTEFVAPIMPSAAQHSVVHIVGGFVGRKPKKPVAAQEPSR